MKSTISVVMAVYNGQKYIEEQINSILTQSSMADELIIIDDCSSEKCTKIIEKASNKADCKINYIEHLENKGYAQTFFEALKMASGEYIFFSDQDDIWDKNKIRICVDEMNAHPEITCLSSCNIIINHLGEEIKKEKKPKQKLLKVTCEDLIKQISLRPGMTLAIRKSLKEKVILLDTTKYEAHDRFIEYISSLDDGFYVLGQYLNRYRIHNSNTSGMNLSYFKLRSNKKGRIDQIDKELRYLNEIVVIEKKNEEIINKYIKYFLLRRRLLEDGKLFKYIANSTRCIYGYSSIKVWLGDIMSIIDDMGGT